MSNRNFIVGMSWLESTERQTYFNIWKNSNFGERVLHVLHREKITYVLCVQSNIVEDDYRYDCWNASEKLPLQALWKIKRGDRSAQLGPEAERFLRRSNKDEGLVVTSSSAELEKHACLIYKKNA